ncbi:hypothetical protein LJC74_06795 [Eubacteriales bacterium OttesenSCG-928-A19]|nr:hypothetical protein [Eubacteriales bacterium OttesenSCG-928-A19]
MRASSMYMPVPASISTTIIRLMSISSTSSVRMPEKSTSLSGAPASAGGASIAAWSTV